MNVVITGITGYISKSLCSYLEKYNEKINVSVISVRGNLNIPAETDIIIHAAALVHKKESLQNEEEYFKVNTDLTYELALKSRNTGVKQFIFLSTMAIYGDICGAIGKCTQIKPVTFYGKSKLAAEESLQALQDEHFKVAIVRPPMIYGPACPGNYKMLSKLSCKSPIFPKIENKRSMLFIDNLCEFILQLIQNKESGIFHPQDPQYITTSIIVKEIAKANKKSVYLSKLAGKLLNIFIGNTAIYQKVFGDLYYEESVSLYKDNSYQKFNLQQSITVTERKQ